MRALLVVIMVFLAVSTAGADDTADLVQRNIALKRKLAEAQDKASIDQERRARFERFEAEGADSTKAYFVGLWNSFITTQEKVAQFCKGVGSDIYFGAGADPMFRFRNQTGIPRQLAAELSANFNRSYAGSTIDCWQGQGSFVAEDGTEYQFANTFITRAINRRGAGGLTYEITQHGSQVRISDLSGNYIVLKGGGKAGYYVDAKLPIGMQSSGAVLAQGAGVTLSNNELIEALNEVYNQWQPGGGRFKNPAIMAEALLLNQTDREALVAKYKEMHAPAPKK